MPDHTDAVKGIVRLFTNWVKAADNKGETATVASYQPRIDALEALLVEVEDLRRITKPIPASYGDLSDLPLELMKELSGIKVDDLEQQIYTIIKSGGGEVDLDAVLIELFRRFKVIQTRKFLQNKLWRMAQKSLIFSVAGKKGIYSADAARAESAARPAAPVSSWDTDLDDDVPF